MSFGLKLNKKKITIISAVGILLLAAILLIVFFVKKNEPLPEIKSIDKNGFTPDILNVEEKTKLGIPVEAKIQAMTRDENGEVTVYKIIKNDSDIIDPKEVGTVTP